MDRWDCLFYYWSLSTRTRTHVQNNEDNDVNNAQKAKSLIEGDFWETSVLHGNCTGWGRSPLKKNTPLKHEMWLGTPFMRTFIGHRQVRHTFPLIEHVFGLRNAMAHHQKFAYLLGGYNLTASIQITRQYVWSTVPLQVGATSISSDLFSLVTQNIPACWYHQCRLAHHQQVPSGKLT